MTCNRNGGISIVITARVGDPTFSLRRQSDPMAEKDRRHAPPVFACSVSGDQTIKS
jgi:hypothetical protein